MFGRFGTKRSKNKEVHRRETGKLDRAPLERALSSPTEATYAPSTEDDLAGDSAQIQRTLTVGPPTYSLIQEDLRSKSPTHVKDPEGLHVVHNPADGHKLDIIFVHGLGGTSRLSWSKNKDLEKFWPLKFLPLEPDICHGRILTFGYNASIFRNASNKSSSVLDFAKELLFHLKYATGDDKEELKIGLVPVIFVVHSMGGLIVKEAYLQGQNDPDYENIIRAISAILFLSTPHRGTNLAETLNRILQASFVSTPKQYITDLTKNSFTLQKLNDQFRHVAPKLDIISFYETQMTAVGFQKNKIMVLEKESSVLGYPGEISKALNADHHGVCKYDSPQDPLYLTIRNVLKSLVKKLPVSGLTYTSATTPEEDGFDSEYLLGISEPPDTDYIFFRDRWTQGTCGWILKNEIFLDWLNDHRVSPRMLWLHGSPASGKSVLASFVINHLVEKGALCQYFFIRFGDQHKRSISMLLRSLALQVADSLPAFRQRLRQLSDEAAKLKTADAQTIWLKLFKSILFKIQFTTPLYWVIDGLEESDTPRSILKLIFEVFSVSVPIRVLIVSRKTQDLSSAFRKVFNEALSDIDANEGNTHDFEHFIDQELKFTNDTRFRREVTKQILEGAQGNFLWVHLAVQKINKCHTKADVRKALEHLPPGMEALYGRMAQSVDDNPGEANRNRASDILAWVTCALRTLTVQELSQALGEEDQQIIDLPKSIEDLCGGFVVVDNDANVAMIHQTAREYLIGDRPRQFSIPKRAAHELLFERCMLCLMENGLRANIKRGHAPVLLDYAAASWFRHLCQGAPLSDASLSTLMRFLKSSSVLVWIQTLASREQLRVLISASTYLSTFALKLKTLDLKTIPTSRQIPEREVVEHWAVDLVKIVGKFGANLSRNPEAIHKFIPPFCPRDSILYQQYGRKESKSLNVSGFSNNSWDDSLARLSFGSGTHVQKILAVGAYITILSLSGIIFIYRANTFEEVHQLKHGERVPLMQLNSLGTLLATYGYATTKVWNISNGKCVVSAHNPARQSRPKSIIFADDDSRLLLSSDDGCVRTLSITESRSEYHVIAELDEQQLDGTLFNSPSCMAISPDGNQVAIGYRSHPASVWEVSGPELVGHCSRAFSGITQSNAETAWGEVIQVTWHPYTGEVLGLYLEGIVFKWHPYEDDTRELRTGGAKLVISQDGNFFATGDANGMVKLFSTSEFCLVYQLAAQNPVLDLSFSPESHRLYDVRGSYGNVWEPMTLVRLSELTERSSDDASDAGSQVHPTAVSEVASRNIDSITALAAQPNGSLYSLGTEDGVVELYQAERGRIRELGKSKSFMSTEQMTWSPNGRYVAFADLSGRLFVNTVKLGSVRSEPWEVEAKLEMPISKERGAVLQLLFHPNSSAIFVYTSSTVSVISVATNTVDATHALDPPAPSYRWINHPTDEKSLLAIGPGTIQVWAWDSLQETSTSHITSPFAELLTNMSLLSEDGVDSITGLPDADESSRLPRSTNLWEIQETVDCVLLTSDRAHVLVQTSCHMGRSRQRHRQVILFAVADLKGNATTFWPEPVDSGLTASTSSLRSNSNMNRQIEFISLPENLASQIEIPLSILSRDRLIFLDKNFWVCSWRLPLPSNVATRRTSESGAPGRVGSGMAEITQHYFLPGDWISPDCVALCTVMSDGTVLCPRNGEVAVIKCSSLRN